MAEYNQYVNLQERALQYYNQNTDQKDEKDEADDDVQLNLALRLRHKLVTQTNLRLLNYPMRQRNSQI